MSSVTSRSTKAEILAAHAAQAEQIADLQATVQELTDAVADKAIAKADEHIKRSTQYDEDVVARVNRRSNPHGPVLNCKINPEYTGELAEDSRSVGVMAKALNETLNSNIKVRKDKHGNTWVDVYPSVAINRGAAA